MAPPLASALPIMCASALILMGIGWALVLELRRPGWGILEMTAPSWLVSGGSLLAVAAAVWAFF